MPPNRRDLDALRGASAGCRGCPLYAGATQTVFGEGPVGARLLLVGEQPGDREDVEGEPFVGPAGRLLDRALAAAEVGRDDVYLTNAVKHFKWEPRGPRRLHKTPSARERAACRPWLLAEIEAVAPSVIVCLGATAGQALLGPSFRVSAARGSVLEAEGRPVVPTIHPSAILRQRDDDQRHAAFRAFVADLQLADRAAGAA